VDANTATWGDGIGAACVVVNKTGVPGGHEIPQTTPVYPRFHAGQGSPTDQRIKYEGEPCILRRRGGFGGPCTFDKTWPAGTCRSVTANVARGEPLVRCQLLASEFPRERPRLIDRPSRAPP
jgi:hypothetical protein